MMRWSFLYLAAALIFFAPPLAAQSAEQDSALQAYRSGEVAGLPRILARARGAYHGRVLDVDLINNRAVYMVKMLTPQGNVIMLYLNAKTAAILSVRGRGAAPARKRQ